MLIPLHFPCGDTLGEASAAVKCKELKQIVSGFESLGDISKKAEKSTKCRVG
ncbi:MAG: hypothetical protein KGI75_21760 [Rhizobiaceae bacterium]|nr:hypothetical protein [Rhizobiaceae bacterium]